MKFAHMADCHLGSWRDPKLHSLSIKAFMVAVDKCIKENVDFVIIAGDLFNTSFPSFDSLNIATKKLKQLKDEGIQVYVVPGSHDFSPSGKTMLDVLENAGLMINVVKGEIINNKLNLKFTLDNKTGAKITGMLGRRGALEKSSYEQLNKESLENKKGFKIFIFHSAITEFKPSELDVIVSNPLSFLPKGFDYYAGGHVHTVMERKQEGYGLIVYPGPLFPNSFKEIEDLGTGGFYIYDSGDIRFEPIKIVDTFHIDIGCENKTPERVREEIFEKIKGKDLKNTLVTLRLDGVLETGKPSDINFKEIFDKIYEKSAYFVMKNTNKLASKEFKEVKLQKESIDELESSLINEHVGQIKIENMNINKEKELTKKLINILSAEKNEGETNTDFEKRVKQDVFKILEEEKTI
ncbi:exonuclease SbcCD subunit D [Candidatus Woesearchaeota archaeon]|nr:exonuclease SbcCD subunit D [Candidatus Woesearchaeota archaeon]